MDKVELTAETRTSTGSRESRRLRRSGRLPANLYGHQQQAQSLHVDARAFADAMRRHARLVSLKVGGKEQAAVVHELQYDPLSQAILHADLVRVDLTERVEVDVPVKFIGPAKGEMDGGILMELHGEISVSCLPTQIPDCIEVDIRDLGIGNALHVRDLTAPEGTELAGDLDLAVVTIGEPRYAAEAEEEVPEGEEGAAPEGEGEETPKPEGEGGGS